VGERVEGLDEAWLARAAARDPFAHAYACWDLRHEPDRVRFVSYREGSETRAYRLEWRGPLYPPVIHWVGDPGATALLEEWPERPFVAVVPPELLPNFRERFGPVETYGIELRRRVRPPTDPRSRPRGRRLVPSDRPELAAFVAGESERLLEGYREVDLERIPCFGAFEGPRLRAVAKASVTLPRIWILTGIVTAAAHRGRGFGGSATEAAARAAEEAGAQPGLYVRADNAAATRLYGALGFRVESRRVWIDAGANWAP